MLVGEIGAVSAITEIEIATKLACETEIGRKDTVMATETVSVIIGIAVASIIRALLVADGATAMTSTTVATEMIAIVTGTETETETGIGIETVIGATVKRLEMRPFAQWESVAPPLHC